jgi:hypothetical protein
MASQAVALYILKLINHLAGDAFQLESCEHTPCRIMLQEVSEGQPVAKAASTLVHITCVLTGCCIEIRLEETA